ncbi:MAG: hypothetical protein CMM56_07760 [Rhodospirillaceae bacterium]|nr:hypothetical protein [Rhodospirillaceae bacterium]|tara:strand:- start:176 stop:571 length:396 start_codon:yes stop_codon:yes gene_type:complete
METQAKTALILCALILFTLNTGSEAHHANSAYDRTKSISVTGTVTQWQFINPHVGIFLDVINEQGNTENWSGEFQSVQDLYRFFRWNKDTFKPGDEVTIIGNPDRRPNMRSMWTEAVELPDGTHINVRNDP